MLFRSIETDIKPENSWTVAKKLPNMSTILAKTLEKTFLWLPIPNVNPVRSFSSYTLKDGYEPVEADHYEFYERYKDVGVLPMYSLFDSVVIKAKMLKAFGGLVEPII